MRGAASKLTCVVAVKRGTASRVDTPLRVVSALREYVAARAAAGLRAVAARRASTALGFFIAVEDILAQRGSSSHATRERLTRPAHARQPCSTCPLFHRGASRETAQEPVAGEPMASGKIDQ